MSKSILFMKGYFPPEVASSNQMFMEMIEVLDNHGYNISIVTPIPTRGVDKNVRKEYKKRKKECLHTHTTIKRYWLPIERHSSFARAFRYFLQSVFQLVYGLCHKYDILFLYSTPPTNGLVGGLLRKIKKRPFIYYVQDIFPDSLVAVGKTSEGTMIWKLGRRMENLAYANSNCIVTLTEGMRNNIAQKGISVEKIYVVPTWVNPKHINHVDRNDNSLFYELGIDKKKFIVTYAGNIGEAQSVGTLIRAARLLKDDSETLFVIIGDGSDKANCLDMADGLHNVLFFPMQAPERISEVYSLGDVSTVLCKKGIGSIGMPSKVCSILSAGVLLLAAFDQKSDLGRMINGSKIGYLVEPENEYQLADIIRHLKEHRETLVEYARQGREFLESNFTANKCIGQILEILSQYE